MAILSDPFDTPFFKWKPLFIRDGYK